LNEKEQFLFFLFLNNFLKQNIIDENKSKEKKDYSIYNKKIHE